MLRSMQSILYILILIMSFALACGGADKKEGTDNPNPVESAADEENAGSEGDSTGDEQPTDAPATCGDNVVNEDQNEQCDDGNSDDDDGCTSLCEFTCESNADCSDENPCNGEETCDNHVCLPGTEKMGDGESCGVAASCYQGNCIEHSCGDGIIQGDEECDDENEDDSDGCRTDCMFTCEEEDGDEVVSEVNDCNPTAVCNGETHRYEGGEPLPDDTNCHRGEGYCSNGICVLSVCGDGIQQPNEDCDLGESNGVAESECSATCTVSECGDGVVEGSETCDDGNTSNMDGCDYRCKAELTFRGTVVEVVTDPAPDYCYYSDNENGGNLFGSLFVIPDLFVVINQIIQDSFDAGEAHTLFHALDLDDFSGNEPDPLANLGISMGEPEIDWTSREDKLDFPMFAYNEYFDEELQPIDQVPGELIILDNGKQVVQSTAPITAGFDIFGMKFVFHNMMSRIEVDDARSPIPPPPDNIDQELLVPETVGGHWETTHTGIICGAMTDEAFSTIPLPPELALLCTNMLDPYIPCEEGMDFSAGECDSMLDLIKGGCFVLGLLPLLNPLPPDVDIDDDGENDAWSAIIRVAGQRVKVVGTMDRPEDSEPAF